VPDVRAVLALLLAYAIALQSLLFAGSFDGVAQFSMAPICTQAGGSGPAAPGRAHDDCLTACLADACGGPALAAPDAHAVHAPVTHRTAAVVIERAPAAARAHATGAHRSRGPPLA